jgi:sulfopyruvate decarboxylase TPP-binding subunit
MRTRRSDADLEQIEDADVHGFLCWLRCVGVCVSVRRHCTAGEFWPIEQKRQEDGMAASGGPYKAGGDGFAVVIDAYAKVRRRGRAACEALVAP